MLDCLNAVLIGSLISVEEDWWTYLTDPSYTLVAGMLCGLAVNFFFRYTGVLYKFFPSIENPFFFAGQWTSKI